MARKGEERRDVEEQRLVMGRREWSGGWRGEAWSGVAAGGKRHGGWIDSSDTSWKQTDLSFNNIFYIF